MGARAESISAVDRDERALVKHGDPVSDAEGAGQFVRHHQDGHTCGAGIHALVTAGCGGKILYPHYYTLDLPAAPSSTATDPRLRATVAVRPFQTPAYLRQGRIVYRQSAAEIGFYEYHRWAAEPAATVTSGMIEALRSSHLFSFVKPYDGQSEQDYLMSGRIEQLEEIDSAEEVRVAARLSAELLDLRTGATVWAGEAGETSKVESRNVNSVVVEMSHAMQKSIDRLVGSLRQQISVNSEVVR